MEKNLKSIAINWGIYLGTFLSLMTIIVYATNLDLFVNFTYGISLYFIIIIFGIISVIKIKSISSSYISFKNAFTSYFITILIGLVLSSIISYVIFNFIDIEASEVLKDKMLDKVVQTLEGFNAPTAAIDEAVNQMESQNLFSITNVLQSLAFNYLLPLTVIGLIVAAAMKKNNPEDL